MPDGQSLEFSGVTKRFGAVTAVADLSARVEPGRVTGFLGPNGAGKTTTLRILLGLVRATHGHATIGGRRYAELDRPLQTVGAVLEASSFHPGRTGASHLTIYAQAAGIPRSRVDEVLGLVGLADAGGRKVGGYSLGMRQRLGLAYALLGDPGVLVLDEPANGLDPEGIRWMRGFLRQLAAEGRTVLVSSHLLAEVQQTVDSLLILSRGRLVFEGAIDDLADPSEYATVVDAPDRAALTAALESAGLSFEVLRSGLTVRGADPVAVGAIAASSGVALSSLQRRGPALEEIFLDLVNGTRVHAPADEADQDAVAPGAATAVVAAAEAAAVETEAADTAEAEESALAAAELDAEATGSPGAAAALGAAAGAVWAEEHTADDPEPEDAEPEPEPDTPDADTVPAAPEAGAEPEPEPNAPEPEPDAGTVPAAPEAGAEPEPEPDTPDPEPDPDAPEPEPDTPEPEPDTPEVSAAEPAPDASAPAEPAVTTGAGFAVASTGVIDIVTPDRTDPAPDPEDADPDVEELGAIDDELSTGEPPDEDDDRPWENYVKTDADVDADAFFAAFDAGDAQRAADAAATGADVDAEAPVDASDPDPADPETDERPQEAASTRSPEHDDEGGER